jgi:sugar phosphate isomerase/epimerase
MAPTIGVQLYTVRDSCRRDFLGTLHAVAGVGYPAVEGFGSVFGAPHLEVRRTLDELGLVMPSAHVPLEGLEGRLDEAIDLWGGLGCHTLVCPWVDEATRTGPGAWERLGDRLDRVGERLRAQGLALAYHNHDFELANGDDGLARLLGSARPEHLGLELDAFWIEHAGRDPVAYLRGKADRVRLAHLKDGRHRPLAFRPLGEGEVNLPGFIEAATAAGVSVLYVEQDESDGDPLEALRRSAAMLRRLGLL